MDGVLFIVMLGCLGLIAGWYVVNERRSADGDAGWFGLSADDDGGAEKSAYYRGARRRDQKPIAAEAERVRAAAAEAEGAPRGAFKNRRVGGYRPASAAPAAENSAHEDGSEY